MKESDANHQSYVHWGDVVAECSLRSGPLVVGIDPVYEHIPHFFKANRHDVVGQIAGFRRYISFLLETISDNVAFVKYQSAFFEALGSAGVEALSQAITEARDRGLKVVLDAKRGDIISTAEAYARAYLTPYEGGSVSDLEVDCMTINPFLGPDTLEPFIHCARVYGKGLFILSKTSNPSAGWLQDKPICGVPLSDYVARKIASWADECVGEKGLSAIGAVVGATFAKDGQRLRQLMPKSIFLAPGIGAQGAEPSDIAAMKAEQGGGILVPVSRSITDGVGRVSTLTEYKRAIVDRIHALKRTLS